MDNITSITLSQVGQAALSDDKTAVGIIVRATVTNAAGEDEMKDMAISVPLDQAEILRTIGMRAAALASIVRGKAEAVWSPETWSVGCKKNDMRMVVLCLDRDRPLEIAIGFDRDAANHCGHAMIAQGRALAQEEARKPGLILPTGARIIRGNGRVS